MGVVPQWPSDVPVPLRKVPRRPVFNLKCRDGQHVPDPYMDACKLCGLTGLQAVSSPRLHVVYDYREARITHSFDRVQLVEVERIPPEVAERVQKMLQAKFDAYFMKVMYGA